MRGLAALSVVFYHSFLQSPAFSRGIRQFQPEGAVAWWATISPMRLLWAGKTAVWLFFVLSGFVLTRRFWDGQRTPWVPYYKRRFARLFLPVVGSAAVAVVIFAVGNALAGAPFALLPQGTTLHQLLNNLTLVGATDIPLNGVWWSMRWEVWFSILLPLLLVVLPYLGCGPRRRYAHAPAVFGVLCAATVVMVPWVRLTFDTSPLWNRVQQYLPIFGIGVALAAFETLLRSRVHQASTKSGWAILGVSAVALAAIAPLGALDAAYQIDRRMMLGLQNAVILVGVVGLMVLSLSWLPAITVLGQRSVQWLGIRSYSLYLVHFPIVHAVDHATGIDGCPLWFPPVVVALSLGATALFYRFVEIPSIQLARWLGRPRPRRDRATDVGLTASSSTRLADVSSTQPGA